MYLNWIIHNVCIQKEGHIKNYLSYWTPYLNIGHWKYTAEVKILTKENCSDSNFIIRNYPQKISWNMMQTVLPKPIKNLNCNLIFSIYPAIDSERHDKSVEFIPLNSPFWTLWNILSLTHVHRFFFLRWQQLWNGDVTIDSPEKEDSNEEMLWHHQMHALENLCRHQTQNILKWLIKSLRDINKTQEECSSQQITSLVLGLPSELTPVLFTLGFGTPIAKLFALLFCWLQPQRYDKLQRCMVLFVSQLCMINCDKRN